MQNGSNNLNLKGLRIPRPKGPASLILEPMRDWIWNTLNCFWSPSIKAKILSSDGTQTLLKEADIQMSPLGWTAVIDLTDIVGSGSTSTTVPFSGSGAPSASTLAAGTYVAGPTPSLYVDLSNLVLYACTTAGTETTSAWSIIGAAASSSPLVLLFAITSISNADYFTAVPITISFPSGVLNVAFGASTAIAKPNRMRTSIASELIDGVTVSYSGYTSDNTRLADDGTNSEYQVVFPRYTTATTLSLSTSSTLTGATALAFLGTQCVIKAIYFPDGTGLVDGSSASIVWEEITTRVWARRYVQ